MKMPYFSVFFLMTLMPGITSGGSRSLRYFYTGVSGIPEFPEYVSVGYVDDQPITKYDSINQRYELQAHWLAENVDEAYRERHLQISQGNTATFKAGVKILMGRTNQTAGIHSLQWMYGCSMNDGTPSGSSGFEHFGYDGQDYITFDKETLTWTAAAPTAVITKNKWDPDTARNTYKKQYFEQTCIEWLEKYIKYGQTSLERKVPPEAKMTDKTESDSTKLKCRVSGFYPKDIDVYFVKGDNEKIETAASSGVVPNSDGTYYTEKLIEIDPQDKYHYSCHIEHGSLIPKLTVKLDKTSNIALIAGIIIAAVAVILTAVIAVVVCKKKQKGGKHYTPANKNDHAESSSNSSENA